MVGLNLALLIAPIARLPLSATGQASSGHSDPAGALADALIAACRQDAPAFASHLTAKNAVAFRQLDVARRTALLKRFVLLEDQGKPLLSTGDDGHTVLRCESSGIVSEMRFGATISEDNLSFISVDVPQAPAESQSVRFGLVREGGEWKLLSLGLLLLDVPALVQQWEAGELADRESEAVASLEKIAAALQNYRNGYGKLPEGLDQLGPPGTEGASPEHAGLLEKDLAAGQTSTYQFRYTIVPAGQTDESEQNKLARFLVAATPLEYGKTAVRSFLLDSSGVLHGADKQGAVATVTDPRITESSP